MASPHTSVNSAEMIDYFGVCLVETESESGGLSSDDASN